MNKLKGTIVHIETSKNISLVKVDASGEQFTSIVLDSAQSAPYLVPGGEVFVLFKETEVSIAKGLCGQISLKNRFKSRITNITKGEILAQVELDLGQNRIVSIITADSCERMGLKKGDEVEALVKANEMILMGVQGESESVQTLLQVFKGHLRND